MTRALWAFYWTVQESVTQFGLWFWLSFGVMIGALVWTYRRSKPIEHWKLTLLAVFPLMWIFNGLWGGYFYYLWVHEDYSDWVFYPGDLGIWVYLGCAIGLILYLRGVRLFASLFAFLNLYFMLYMIISFSPPYR